MTEAFDKAKASALAAFRAGRRAGHWEALCILRDLAATEIGTEAKRALQEARERISLIDVNEAEATTTEEPKP